MEVLNYSLWFTLVWWVFVLYAMISNIKRVKPTPKGLFITMIVIPAPVIFLEYLIMR